jgi:hypothetical protein
MQLLSIMQMVEDAGYAESLAGGNTYYDAVEELMQIPYAQAKASFQELEAAVDSYGPAAEVLLPSLGRYQFTKTRGEAARRATLLVTELKAYQQQYGTYPESLAALADPGVAADPFTGEAFIYQQQGDDFVLYSRGADGLDSGGRHDPRGEEGDIVFWPRPENPDR